MKLPQRDYPIGPMTSDELEVDAARLVRAAKGMRMGKPGTPEHDRQRRKRANALYGALFCTVAAKRVRKRGAATYSELGERDRRKVINETDKHARAGTHIEDIY